LAIYLYLRKTYSSSDTQRIIHRRFKPAVARLIVEKVYGPEPETVLIIKPLAADAA
jgi:hypothetical protein